jgi:hypothetical protein
MAAETERDQPAQPAPKRRTRLIVDARYLALAERESCEYWTADERLWNSVRAQLGWVRWLGEYLAAASPTGLP